MFHFHRLSITEYMEVLLRLITLLDMWRITTRNILSRRILRIIRRLGQHNCVNSITIHIRINRLLTRNRKTNIQNLSRLREVLTLDIIFIKVNIRFRRRWRGQQQERLQQEFLLKSSSGRES